MFHTNSKTHSFLMSYGGIAAVAVIAVAAMGWITHLPTPSEPAPNPAPAPAVHPVAIAAPAHTTTVAPATSAPAPTVSAIGPVLLPAQPEPAGLTRGYVARSIASSQQPAVGDRPVWTPLASEAEASPTASWSTAIPAAMRSIAPSSGIVRTRLVAFVRVATAGAHTIILSVSNGPARASVTIDGQAQPLATIARACSAFTGCPAAPTTDAGAAQLAAGLHTITLTATSAVSDPPTVLDVYSRGPGASMPVAIVPWAVHATAADTTTPTTQE